MKAQAIGIPKIFIQDYEIDLSNLLGKGGFGFVYPGKHKYTGKEVAVKISKPIDFFNENEVKLMGKLDHPNLIKIHGYDLEELQGKSLNVKKSYRSFIVMDRAEADLKTFLIKNPMYFQDINNVLTFMKSMIEVGSYLHSQKIAHRDIKPGNILFLDGRWVLTDTNALKESSGGVEDSTVGTLITSKGYDAPEILTMSNMTDWKGWQKCDVYSMGIVFLEVCGMPSFVGKSLSSMKERLVYLDLMILECSLQNFQIPLIIHLLHIMLRITPDDRTDFAALKASINSLNSLQMDITSTKTNDHTAKIKELELLLQKATETIKEKDYSLSSLKKQLERLPNNLTPEVVGIDNIKIVETKSEYIPDNSVVEKPRKLILRDKSDVNRYYAHLKTISKNHNLPDTYYVYQIVELLDSTTSKGCMGQFFQSKNTFGNIEELQLDWDGLQINFAKDTDGMPRILTSILKMKSLKAVIMPSMKLTSHNSKRFLELLSGLPTRISDLDLIWKEKCSEEDIIAICQHISNIKITNKFNWSSEHSNSNFGDNLLKAISKAITRGTSKEIEHLTLNFASYYSSVQPDERFILFCKGISLKTQLSHLHLNMHNWGGGMTEESLIALSKLLSQLTRLKSLEISLSGWKSTGKVDNGFQVFAERILALKTLYNLSLNLDGCGSISLSDIFLTQLIAGILSLKQLQRLSLHLERWGSNNSKITYKGFGSLHEMLYQLASLSYLELGLDETPISQSFVIKLAESLSALKSLKKVIVTCKKCSGVPKEAKQVLEKCINEINKSEVE
jgi:serine/threonine protein kinase